MKKRLEAELISIAHRILKLKNKSEIDQLYNETRKLYEALSILKFYEENYNALKSEVSQDEMEQKVESFLAEKETTNPVDLPIVEAEPIAETKEEIRKNPGRSGRIHETGNMETGWFQTGYPWRAHLLYAGRASGCERNPFLKNRPTDG